MRYARGCDRCDRDTLMSALHPDAVVDYNVFRGRAEEFCDWVLPLLRTFTLTTHLNANHLIEFDSSRTRATGEVYVTATFRFEKEGELYDLQGLGRYLDEYELRDGVWRIASRRTITDSERTVRVPTENATELVEAVGTLGTRDRRDPSYACFARLSE
jgi:SnoaL-like domain